MKFSLNWLRDYVALEAPADEISRAITFLGFEVEQVTATGAPRLDGVVVGEVLTREKHPNADKLSVCTVDVGAAGGVKTIVCGAQNYTVGDRVPVALPGAVLPGNFVIRQSKIRGQLSDGMMCSGREIGIGDDHGGLLLLRERPAVGTPINAVLPPGDTVFDVEITPNRPDCLSHLGLARELAARFKLVLAYPQERYRGEGGAAARPDLLASVRVDAPEDCPLYSAHVIAGIRIGPSPAWMQERLRAVGLRPVNNVVDVGNYVMLEYGQPMHAFDARRLRGAGLVVRRAGDGERIVTLDGRERALSSRMLVIADRERPVVVAGIMGGLDSGIDSSTTDLVLECAVFRPQGIRWTSRMLGLSSDSSYRYERGVDPHLAQEASWRAVDLILETAGGVVAGPAHRCGGDVPWSREIALTSSYVTERLGFPIAPEEMRASLASLELDITREENLPGGSKAWIVAIPSWRDDLDRPIDLVEEILRLFGTERIPPGRVAGGALVADDDPVVAYTRKVTEILVGHDFNECVNLTLRPGPEVLTWASTAAAAELALANPFVADQSHLRPSLVMGLLDTLRLNRSRGVQATRLFETGRIFAERNGQNLECVSVAFIVAEDARKQWLRRGPADFYAAKREAETLAAAAGIDLGQGRLEAVGEPAHGWQKGHSAQAGDIAVGWTARFGQLDLGLLRSLGIEGRVHAGEFFILPERLQEARARPRYADLPLFPAALRDVALVVPSGARAGDVREALLRVSAAAAADPAGPRVESVDVFDVYEGAGIAAGFRSLAFSLVFRSPSRTLTDDEVNAVFLRIQEAIAAVPTYTLRK